MSSQKSFLCNGVQDTDEVNLEFETLLDYLKYNQGCDLTGYKRSSLMRRFRHRMQSINIDTYESYLQYLQRHWEEYRALLNDVLINVTSFFRDRKAWDYLAAEVIPKIIASKQPDEPIRIWSAGCATGQEIYSLLILLAEALGLEVCRQRVQCFATDTDEAALSKARQATYSNKDIIGIPAELLQKYFEYTETGYVFHPELRRTIIFSRHDLTQNAPISKIDLLICRNVLIYFNSETQVSVLKRFHFALKNTGFLFLGKAETVINRRQIYMPVNINQRIYAKELTLEVDDYRLIIPKSHRQHTTHLLPIQNYFWETAFETSSFAYLAIDANGCLLHANEWARTLFGLTFNNWKRPFQDLKVAKLIGTNTLTQALHSRQALAVLKNIEWTTSKSTKHFDIHISQVFTTKNDLLGVTLTFIETNDYKQFNQELESTRLELARVSKTLAETKYELSMAYNELESTRKELELLHQQTDFINQI
ncbi:chemotaxis protein CheR [Scytonema hofmannii PCC 7110]|uniref:protein-glutamate O-methyltransferase n=2 Tax=Scytonema hofmannii TaxID=34078 RepID=A0A139XAK8_9CYAN|nr:chemotaxis protein CheR [Scytonema hofmannii PCC 7110]